MACLYKRGGVYWIAYRVGGRLIQESPRTKNERLSWGKKRKIEYEPAVGDLQIARKLPLPAILEAFCCYLETIRTRKSHRKPYPNGSNSDARFHRDVLTRIAPAPINGLSSLLPDCWQAATSN